MPSKSLTKRDGVILIKIGSRVRNFKTTELGEVLDCSASYLRVRFRDGDISHAALHLVVRKAGAIWINAPSDFGSPLVDKPAKRNKAKPRKSPSKPRVKLADKVAAVCDELGIDVATLKRRCKMTGLTLREFVDDEQEEAA